MGTSAFIESEGDVMRHCDLVAVVRRAVDDANHPGESSDLRRGVRHVIRLLAEAAKPSSKLADTLRYEASRVEYPPRDWS
jgi:hypothetical protein